MIRLLPALSLVVLVLGCGGGDADPGSSKPAERATNVRVMEVTPRDFEETLTITGPVRAVRATDVSTQEGGVVEAIVADRGSRVSEGDVVVRLDRDMLDAERKSAEAAKILRQYNEERTRTLMEANSISKQEMLIAHTELVRAQEAARMADLRYQRAAIKAPFDGLVAERYVEEGELVSPGTRVARIVDPFVLRLEGWVTEREVAWLREGAPALVSVDGHDGTVEASVHWIGVEADRATGKFPVDLRLPNPDLRIRAGVVGRARVLKTVHPDVVTIPRDAIVQGRHGTVVYVVEDDRAVQKSVDLGPDQGLMVVVRDGLEVGETLVVRGQRELGSGSLVRIRERSDRPDGTLDSDPAEVRQDAPDLPVEDVATPTLEGSR